MGDILDRFMNERISLACMNFEEKHGRRPTEKEKNKIIRKVVHKHNQNKFLRKMGGI